MKNYYKIDFLKLLIELLPIKRRKPKFIALRAIVASQLQKIHFEFIEFITSFEHGAKTQKCFLQAEINKWFDPYKQRIVLRTIKPNYNSYLLWLEDSENVQVISESKPFLLQPEGNLLQNQTSFEVVLPIGFSLSVSERSLMHLILEKNKLPSKTYTITNG